jgi:hypothetical protein
MPMCLSVTAATIFDRVCVNFTFSAQVLDIEVLAQLLARADEDVD